MSMRQGNNKANTERKENINDVDDDDNDSCNNNNSICV
jgi:hypothetical protein